MTPFQLPGGTGRLWGAILLSLASVAAVALVLSADDKQEVSLASFCFFGSCKTPPPSAEARWRKEAAQKAHAKKGGIIASGLPCFLGGECNRPSSSRVRKWKRSVRKQQDIKNMQDATRLKKWGAPVPAKAVKRHHKSMTERQLQRRTRHEITLKIQQRARFLSRKSTESPQISTAKVSVHASNLKTLSLMPTAQKKLKRVLAELSVAETTKVAAEDALKHAQNLTKVANEARAAALSFKKTVTASIAKAKADEKAHQLALRRVQFLVRRSQQAEAAYTKVKTKLKIATVSQKKLPLAPKGQPATRTQPKLQSEKKTDARAKK